MKIFTWTDKKYLNFCLALCKSIRLNGNEQEIIIDLMDFEKQDFENYQNVFREKIGGELRFLRSDSSMFLRKEESKDEFYRNHRVNQFIELLKEDSRDLCTFGANGIVRTNLKFIENLLNEGNLFVFMERSRDNRFSMTPEKIEGVYELAEMIRDNKLTNNIDEIIQTHSGRCVLLGTHAIKNSEKSLEILRLWQNELKNFKDAYRKKFCDMDFFVKSLIVDYYSTNKKIKMYTAKNIPQVVNPLCDCTFSDYSQIWFAKGDSKFRDKKYINVVNELIK